MNEMFRLSFWFLKKKFLSVPDFSKKKKNKSVICWPIMNECLTGRSIGRIIIHLLFSHLFFCLFVCFSICPIIFIIIIVSLSKFVRHLILSINTAIIKSSSVCGCFLFYFFYIYDTSHDIAFELSNLMMR